MTTSTTDTLFQANITYKGERLIAKPDSNGGYSIHIHNFSTQQSTVGVVPDAYTARGVVRDWISDEPIRGYSITTGSRVEGL